MKQTNIMNTEFESTYALLVRSEEKSRSVLETLVYALFMLGIVVSILQFVQTPVTILAAGLEPRVVCNNPATELHAGS